MYLGPEMLWFCQTEENCSLNSDSTTVICCCSSQCSLESSNRPLLTRKVHNSQEQDNGLRQSVLS
jgi:hypothetical protein